jgi:alpha-galactosidase
MSGMSDFILLHSLMCTVILEIPPGETPLWRYWGPRLADGVLPDTPLRQTRRLPSFALDRDQPLSVFPGFGMGWFAQSALLAHRAGKDWVFFPQACHVHQPDDQQAIISLTDDVAKITVTISLALDADTNVLTLSTKLQNIGDDMLDVQWLASGTLPLPATAKTVRSYTGRHNHEFVAVDDLLTASIWRRENRRGLTSHHAFPGAIISGADASYGAQLAWSGNHAQMIEQLDDGSFQWQMGEWFAPGEVRLAKNEIVTTAEMLATCSTQGADGVSQQFHAAMRTRINWPGGRMTPRPVHLNTWEALYFNHDIQALRDLATASADVGIERFVLDDGWFHKRHDDTSSLGDWWPDTEKYPDGLAPLATYVTSLGMEFGLWVEPEMINPDSELYRARPDWALQIEGRPKLTARNQLVLDMSRTDVTDYLFEKIATLLSMLPIRYLKWDHNRALVSAGETPGYRKQVHACYALMARLRAAFPHVEIESCAGGGGRIDAGILKYTHRFWTSDCIDAVSRMDIQKGFLQFMPPEIMGSHIGTAPAHTTGRSQSLAFRAGVAMIGHLGVELDVRKLSDTERTELHDHLSFYKQHRDLFHSGSVWRGTAGDGIFWQAHGSAEQLLVMIYRVTPNVQDHESTMCLPMLDRAAQYKVTHPDSAEHVLHGAWLAQSGIRAPRLKAESWTWMQLTAIQ